LRIPRVVSTLDVVTAPKRRATYEDLMQVPDTKVAELIDGDLIVSPRPAVPHTHAASVIGGDLMSGFHGPPGAPPAPGGWWILLEPELHFGDDVLVPDWAGWRRERLPVLPDAFVTLAPDWVCEVVSPSTARLDRGRKMPAERQVNAAPARPRRSAASSRARRRRPGAG
jgi:Uma2 family endonuclease